MGAFLALLVLAFSNPVTVVAPVYPPNAIAGGDVTAVLHVSTGTVQSVDILEDGPAFADSVTSALKAWRFAHSENGNILVVVNFRSPTLYSMGSASQAVSPVRVSPGLAFPEKTVEPVYPINSLAEGSVILQLEINGAGAVSKVNVVAGVDSLTQACAAAVRKWQFVPARDGNGASIPSEAYAVCVIRRPILHD